LGVGLTSNYPIFTWVLSISFFTEFHHHNPSISTNFPYYQSPSSSPFPILSNIQYKQFLSKIGFLDMIH
jgi:hypothetical protein